MGAAHGYHEVKLLHGLLYHEEASAKKAVRLLELRYGPVDFESAPLDFSNTAYYELEFGPLLKRKFISHRRLIKPERLAAIKATSNRMETRLCARGKRTVNIDPGYLDLAKFILATTKDFSHRIYLKGGIFAELTLMYQKGSFVPLAWTYPDYRSAQYLMILNHIRALYAAQINT